MLLAAGLAVVVFLIFRYLHDWFVVSRLSTEFFLAVGILGAFGVAFSLRAIRVRSLFARIPGALGLLLRGLCIWFAYEGLVFVASRW